MIPLKGFQKLNYWAGCFRPVAARTLKQSGFCLWGLEQGFPLQWAAVPPGARAEGHIRGYRGPGPRPDALTWSSGCGVWNADLWAMWWTSGWEHLPPPARSARSWWQLTLCSGEKSGWPGQLGMGIEDQGLWTTSSDTAGLASWPFRIGWLHNLGGPVQNKNVGPFFKRQEKNHTKRH